MGMGRRKRPPGTNAQDQDGDMRGTAELIFTGDELLRGDIVNTNQAYLGERLLELGVFATHAVSVTDDREAISRAIVSSLLRHPDILILSGGCLLYTSPSPRDRTRSRMPSSA